MLIYRDAPGVPIATAEMRSRLAADARALAASLSVPAEPPYALSIEVGMLEAAVGDAANPDVEHVHANGLALRDASVAAAGACLAMLAGDVNALRSSARVAAEALDRMDPSVLPDRLSLRTPEGFAYYGLYPDTYADAVRELVPSLTPRRGVCLGIRSVGTTLSAFAAAALQQSGCAVTSWTVRPLGHPHDRVVRLGDDVARLLARPTPDIALIVDEGPGLSGSSFAAAAAALREIGIARERIVLLPAWVPDGERFKSARAAQSWREHRKAHVPFERAWAKSGRLASAFGAASLEDISGGAWRQALARRRLTIPLQPQHERRKYLARHGAGPRARARLLKFGGLGPFGDAQLARAGRLADLPVACPSRLRHGFLEHELLAGRPMSPREASPEFLAFAAAYIADVAARFRLDATADREPLAVMLDTNAREALADSPLPRLASLVAGARSLPDAPAAHLDARLLAHEFLRTRKGYLKVDALEHHDDHFYPGPQEVAWDVAGLIAEFELERPAARAVADAIGSRLRDRTLEARLPFYLAAYLAFRTAYCSVGAEAIGGPDAERLAAAAGRYRSRLRALLE